MTSRSLQCAGLIALLILVLSATVPGSAGATRLSSIPTLRSGVTRYVGHLPETTSEILAARAVSQPAASACELPAGTGGISGTVTAGDTSEPLDSVRIAVYDLTGNRLMTASTNVSGTYTLVGLTGGSYKVRFEPQNESGAYKQEFYSDKSDLASADAVAVADNSITPGIDAALERGGAIAGTIQEGDSGEGLERVTVTVYDVDEIALKSATTTVSGTYTVEGLAAGNYKLRFAKLGSAYLAEYYNNKSDFASADLVTVNGQETTAGIDAMLERGSSISGTVKAPDGGNLAGILVQAYGVNTLEYKLAFSNTAGEYKLDGLRAGSYIVEFTPLFSVFLREFYNDTTDRASAAPIPVAPAAAVTGINATLRRGGQISGTVTGNDDGDPLAQVAVKVYDQQGRVVTTAFSNAEGDYSTVGVPGGEYRLEFEPNELNNNSILGNARTNAYLPEYYTNRTSLASADIVRVTPPLNKNNIDAALERGAQIKGRVTAESDGTGIESVQVAVFDADGNQVTTTATNAEGLYTTKGLRSANYKVKFSPSQLSASRSYAFEYYDDRSTRSLGTTVTLEAPRIQNGIDAELEAGACIAGTVTAAIGGDALPGVIVVASDRDGDEAATTVTNAQGRYVIEGLPDGDYKVEFRPFLSRLAGDHVGEWYNDKPSAASADVVALTGPAGRTDINAALDPGGRITGKVTRPDGAPLNAVAVTFYDSSGASVNTALTNATGVYTSTVLRDGAYTVKFQATGSSEFDAPEFYNNKPERASADPVTVVASILRTGVDAVLERSGGISGRVTAADGGAGVSGVSVRVYAASGEQVASAVTDATGNYSVPRLYGATYRVGFVPAQDSELQTMYYDGKLNLASATPVVVASGAATENINVALARKTAHMRMYVPHILR